MMPEIKDWSRRSVTTQLVIALQLRQFLLGIRVTTNIFHFLCNVLQILTLDFFFPNPDMSNCLFFYDILLSTYTYRELLLF